MITLLNITSRQGVEVLFDLVKRNGMLRAVIPVYEALICLRQEADL